LRPKKVTHARNKPTTTTATVAQSDMFAGIERPPLSPLVADWNPSLLRC